MCGENKGADQLCSYCTADLRLCFRIYKLLVFSCTGSISVFDPKQVCLIQNMSKPANQQTINMVRVDVFAFLGTLGAYLKIKNKK